MEINGLKIELNPMVFVDQMAPTGFLSKDDACHALWYYYILAENGRAAFAGGIENQIIEHETGMTAMDPGYGLWMDKHYSKQARSVAFLYGLESPEQMWPFWPNVALEANRLMMPAPRDEYKNPPIQDAIT
jgi:hypothetical protein